MLNIDPGTIGYIIMKAREFDQQVAPVVRDTGSDSPDDRMVEVLEDRAGNPAYAELMAALRSLNEDQLVDLVALSWIGRGDYDGEEWDDARAEAMAVREKHIPSYLAGTPLLGDYLAEGMSRLGYPADSEVNSHL